MHWKSHDYLSSSFVTKLVQRAKVHAQTEVQKAGVGFLEKQSGEGIAAWNDGKGRAGLGAAREVTQREG